DCALHNRLTLTLVHSYAYQRDLPSFPTRRSSDLISTEDLQPAIDKFATASGRTEELQRSIPVFTHKSVTGQQCTTRWLESADARSEEHTSELQSRFDLVCRLLLEKKNAQTNKQLD